MTLNVIEIEIRENDYNKIQMIIKVNVFRRIGNAAYNAVSCVASVIGTATERRLNSFTNWLTSYVESSQVGRVLDGVGRHVCWNYPPRKEAFEIRESRCVLRRFTTQHSIEGLEGYDPQSFLHDVRQTGIFSGIPVERA